MRTSVVRGDSEMVRMLINAKADVNNRGSNVSACMHGIVRALCVLFHVANPLDLPVDRLCCLG